MLIDFEMKTGRSFISWQSIPSAVTERFPTENWAGAYNVVPVPATELRRKLLAKTGGGGKDDPAARCLNFTDKLRDNYGAPEPEPRHPDLASGRPWPILPPDPDAEDGNCSADARSGRNVSLERTRMSAFWVSYGKAASRISGPKQPLANIDNGRLSPISPEALRMPRRGRRPPSREWLDSSSCLRNVTGIDGNRWRKIILHAFRDRMRHCRHGGPITSPPANPTKTTEKSGRSRIGRTLSRGQVAVLSDEFYPV